KRRRSPLPKAMGAKPKAKKTRLPRQNPIINLISAEVLTQVASSSSSSSWTSTGERLWARQYLGVVRAVKDDDGVFNARRYGRALERVGDDETEEDLTKLGLERHRPPGVRHWLSRVAKKIAERWKSVTEQWPEPWFSCRGNLEEI